MELIILGDGSCLLGLGLKSVFTYTCGVWIIFCRFGDQISGAIIVLSQRDLTSNLEFGFWHSSRSSRRRLRIWDKSMIDSPLTIYTPFHLFSQRSDIHLRFFHRNPFD